MKKESANGKSVNENVVIEQSANEASPVFIKPDCPLHVCIINDYKQRVRDAAYQEGTSIGDDELDVHASTLTEHYRDQTIAEIVTARGTNGIFDMCGYGGLLNPENFGARTRKEFAEAAATVWEDRGKFLQKGKTMVDLFEVIKVLILSVHVLTKED